MSSVQSLRDFISRRLAAAAEEIFLEVERTVVGYQEVVDRQRRLLDLSWTPELKLTRIDFPQQLVRMEEEEEEVLSEQQMCDRGRRSGLDREEPGFPQLKEEHPLRSGLEEPEPLVLKQETETFTLTPTYQEQDFTEPEPEQLHSQNSPSAGNSDQDQIHNLDPGSVTDVEMSPNDGLRIRADGKSLEASSLWQHQVETESGKKSVKCDFCGKSFGKKYYVEQHHRIHTGERPFDCKICGKRFAQKGTLVKHVRTHTGEKPFSCTTCGKSFSRNDNLYSHMRIHAGERAHSSETCRKNLISGDSDGHTGNLLF